MGVEQFRPLVDVKERDKEIVVRAEIPGMNKEDIKVNYVRGALELSGEKSEKKKEKGMVVAFVPPDTLRGRVEENGNTLWQILQAY
jgi:HSP20 family molecular chaperone IbpA